MIYHHVVLYFFIFICIKDMHSIISYKDPMASILTNVIQLCVTEVVSGCGSAWNEGEHTPSDIPGQHTFSGISCGPALSVIFASS